MAIFNATQHMHEKYDVTQSGTVGGGGEYTPQVGFGWSNGVVLTFLQDYFGSYGPDTAAVGPGSRGVKLSAAPQLPPYQPQGTLEAGPVGDATGAANDTVGSAANETTAGIDTSTGAAGSAIGAAGNETEAVLGNATTTGNASDIAALPGAVQSLPGEAGAAAGAAAPATDVTAPLADAGAAGTAPADAGAAGTAPVDAGAAGTAPVDAGTAPVTDAGAATTAPADATTAPAAGSG